MGRTRVAPDIGHGGIIASRPLSMYCVGKGLFYLPERNTESTFPQVSKPFTLPPCPYYKWFSKVVLSFQLKINLINTF
jgi:hypothetical protein